MMEHSAKLAADALLSNAGGSLDGSLLSAVINFNLKPTHHSELAGSSLQ